MFKVNNEDTGTTPMELELLILEICIQFFSQDFRYSVSYVHQLISIIRGI